ncbi:MAG: Gfo/Idh/MocA family oxidoreductase [Oligosphaeraceae bacterium]|nr:Gfo/Idh/MocA family oxidoreductase [Oligosphaeraceae bacterium]
MSKKIKIGIIGAGAIGSVHANAYAKLADAEVYALCDILPDRLAEKAALHNIGKTYEKYEDLLADKEIDAISVCVPNHLHAPVAIAAFEAGKHVMLEKPMTMSAKLGRDILAARDKAGKQLQMGMVWRQAPEAEVVKEAVDAGKLGEIYQIRIKFIRRRGIPGLGGWFTTKAMSGGGGLIDCAVHFLDLAMWTSGLWQPTKVSAKTYSKFGSPMEDYKYVSMWAGPPKYDGVFDVDDYATGLVRFGNKATMIFEVAWACNAEPESYIELLGDKGGVKVGVGDTTILTEVDGYIADVKLAYNEERDRFAAEMQKFLLAIQGKGKVAATGEEGVVVMSLLDAIYKSSDLNAEVDV